MKSYEFPYREDMTRGEAESLLAAFTADARGDSEHPLMLKSHAQHQIAVSYAHALYAAINPEPAAPEPLSDTRRAEAEEMVKAIDETPGFVTGELRREERAAYEILAAHRTRLFARLYPDAPDAETVQAAEDAEAVKGIKTIADLEAAEQALAEDVIEEIREAVEADEADADTEETIEP